MYTLYTTHSHRCTILCNTSHSDKRMLHYVMYQTIQQTGLDLLTPSSFQNSKGYSSSGGNCIKYVTSQVSSVTLASLLHQPWTEITKVRKTVMDTTNAVIEVRIVLEQRFLKTKEKTFNVNKVTRCTFDKRLYVIRCISACLLPCVKWVRVRVST